MTAPDETAAASRGRKPRSPEAQLQRREEIMRSALACFKRKGFHNVSMADIAREDGMSVGTSTTSLKTRTPSLKPLPSGKF